MEKEIREDRLKDIEYARAYDIGYKEGYNKALEQIQLMELNRPIQIFIPKDSIK